MNVALALIAAVLFHLVPILPDWLGPWLEDNLSNAIILNAVLAVFNMLPLPPLDGGRVAVGLLPRSLALPLARLEPMGMLILIGVIFVLPFVLQEMGFRFNPMAELLDTPVRLLVQLIAALAGIG